MQNRVRFIHTADLHLGSSLHYTGVPSTRIKRILDSAVIDSFKRICNIALDYEVDFMLISGDLFDKKQQSITANEIFYEQCQRLNEKGINIYAISGNHDSNWETNRLFDLPENLYLMSSDRVEVKEIKDSQGSKLANILGQSYRGKADSRKMYSFYNPPDQIGWNIGLLHSQLDPSNNNYVPCTYQDLCSKDDLHYWALGHIHQSQILKETNPAIVYSGIPQGRDFGEPGVGGCFLVDLIPKQRPEIKFIPTSSVVWKEITINLREDKPDNPRNLEELRDKIENRAEKFLDKSPEINKNIDLTNQKKHDNFAGYIVRWVIQGRTSLHLSLQDQLDEAVTYLKKELREDVLGRKFFLWTEDIDIKTTPPLPSLEELKERNKIFAEIEEVVGICRDGENSTLKEELKSQTGQVWNDNLDHEDYNEEKFQLDQDSLNKIIDQARERIIEKILAERGE